MENKQQIQQANRKALPIYILIMVISALVGAGIGFLSGYYRLDALSGGIKAAADFFCMCIAPWLLFAEAIALPIVCVPLYKNAKKLLVGWNGEDEEISDAAEHKISMVIWISDAAIIVSYFLIAASYSVGLTYLEDWKNAVPFFAVIAAFFAVMLEAVIIQQKCIDTAKKTNPEKAVSYYDLRFHKKWVDHCDEAEKLLMGKCAFQAYRATNTACTILAVLLAICALVFGIGFLPSLAVCAIQIVNHSAYYRQAMKYTKTDCIL